MSWVGGCRCGSWWWWLGGGSFWSLYSYEFIKTMFLFCLLFHTVMWTDILAGDDSNDEDDVETWDLMMRVSTSGWGPRLSGRCVVCRNHNTSTRARLSQPPKYGENINEACHHKPGWWWPEHRSGGYLVIFISFMQIFISALFQCYWDPPFPITTRVVEFNDFAFAFSVQECLTLFTI